MVWQQLDSGLKLDSPRLAVALVQSEAEMLHTPSHELSAFLRRDHRWRVESFTERTFEGLQRAASQFDCVVIGFNAAYQSPGIRAALRACGPIANMLILHQHSGEALASLQDEFAVELSPLTPRAERVYARERREREEIALNWPETVLDDDALEHGIECSATRRFSYPPRSVWRVVLEVEDDHQRVPVMIRSSTMVSPRIVLCSALLQPRDDPRQAKLLENAITFCALGRPEVAVVERSSAAVDKPENGRLSEGGLLARKLRLQGASTVEVAPHTPRELDFRSWPLREVSHVVLANEAGAEDYLGRSDTKEFLESGGTLVGLDDSGRLLLHSGVSDSHWVAQRWAVWFNAADNDGWLRHLFACRSVLRVLERVGRPDCRAHPERVGLDRPPPEFLEPVAELLAREVSAEGHVDHLVSATVAAHDLNALVGGGALDDGRLDAMRNWLHDAFERASDEDRFDIARTFGTDAREMFERAAAGVAGRSVSVVCVTRMREAAAACGVPGMTVAPDGVELDSLAELDTRPQLCAEFVGALADLAHRRPEDPLGRFDGDLVDRAVATLTKHGAIPDLPDDVAELEPEAISTEALGLIAYFSLTRESTLLVRPETAGMPASAVEPVLQETRRARQAEQEARRDEERMRRPLSLVQSAVGMLALVLAGGVGIAAAFGIALDIGLITGLGLGATVFVGVFVLLALLLIRHELYPRKGLLLANAISEGIPGLRTRLGRLVSEEEGEGRRQRPA